MVVDHFHAIRLANQALDEVRRRTQFASLGHRRCKDDPLNRICRRLLTAHERLSEAAWQRVVVLLELGDPEGEVGAAYLAKELRDAVAMLIAAAHPYDLGGWLLPRRAVDWSQRE